MNIVFLQLGGNLGDREQLLKDSILAIEIFRKFMKAHHGELKGKTII